MNNYLPILFHKSKSGSLVKWQISIQGNEVITEWGQIDGAIQKTSFKSYPKNVGRSNETTAEEQAQLEAKSIWQNKLDRKYSLTPEEAQEEVFLPMLAHDFKKEKKIEYPVFVQTKLDGLRAMVWMDENKEIQIMSRSGKPYNLPHIAKGMRPLLCRNGTVFDGELYRNNTSLQQINSLVKKYKPGPDGTESIFFAAFDAFSPKKPNMPFKDRWMDLVWDPILDPGGEIHHIELVDTLTANSEQDVRKWLYYWMKKGAEGCIVRDPNSIYELGHRSHGLLKLKEFQDAEFKVVGAYEGKGKYAGCVTWVCINEEGREFSCTPRGTIQQKREWFINKDQYINKILTVRFQNRSDDNIPLFPVGITFRLEEDLPND